MIDFMKKHHIPGDKRCLRCSGPTRNVTKLFCLPCLIEMNGQKVVDFALDARFNLNSRFSGPRLLAFAEKHPGIYGITNKSILYLNPIIIKGAGQAQQDIKTIVESRDCFHVSPIIRQGSKSAKSRQPRLHARLDKLLMQLITEQEGLCPYCASSLTPQTTHLDTVLPTGFDHSQICLTTRIKYYEANALAGNLKAVCGACNFHKGMAEHRGVQLLRLIALGKYPAQPVKSTEHFTARQPRIYFTHQDLPGKKRSAYNLAEWETIKQAIECFALRITYPCPHETDLLFACWMEDARTLEFGCAECVQPAGAFLSVNLKSKNWMRTKKHHNLTQKELREIRISVQAQPPHRRCEFAFGWMEKKMRQSFGKRKEIKILLRELHLTPPSELKKQYERLKWLESLPVLTPPPANEKFRRRPLPPFEEWIKSCQARETETGALWFVRRADGVEKN
jgi:hypothetical protein